VYEVVVLSLSEGDRPGGGAHQVRAPVRACVDALVAAGAEVETVTAGSDREIDDAVARATRLVVATAVDAQLRAVVRRMVRRLAPPPSRRPDDLPADRTVPDLPPLAILPLDPSARGLAARLGVPRDPGAVAAAVLGERVRRLDLLRTDGPTAVTLDGTLLGGSDEAGRAVPWRARVEVDDALLSDGDEPLLVGVVANAAGYTRPDGLPLVTTADPADGLVEVAVAVPVRGRWRRRVRVEVRRARGRAVTVRPVGEELACLDDGIAGALTRQRSWWVEPAAWAVYTA
jgi:hypothetical protein